MELVKINTKGHKVVVSPLGDIQWSGKRGPSALDHVKRHIDRALKLDAWFLGMGDYTDFLSPSNRQRLAAASLYDTAQDVIDEKAHELVEEVYNEVLQPTRGRWLGLLEGHHYYEGRGSTSDQWLAELLDARFLGTSAYIRLEPSGVVLLAHHGQGNSVLPTGPLNKLYHYSHGFVGADVYLIGHTTKMSVARLSRPTPDWSKSDLTHSDIFLVNTGGFSKSSIVGHCNGRIPRGEYAEVKMLTPSPLAAPLIYIDGKGGNDRIRVEV
jgi:hypothetical protein